MKLYMAHKNIKAYLKKYLPVIGIVLLLFAAITSYSASRPTVSTFINHQSRVVLADDIFNTCKTSCPTERQTPYSAHVQSQHTLEALYGLAPPSLVVALLYIVFLITKTLPPLKSQTYTIAASKQSLHSMWRI